jgi:(p)ppGpp synthase/HD superfamily hydrolase
MGQPGDLVSEARRYAQEVHSRDVRKGSGVPYFEGHLEPVARIVRRAGGDSAQVAAAYLHDTAEDHGGRQRLEDIAVRFGGDVAGMVRDLSDSLVDTDAGEAKAPWLERKQSYLDALAGKPVRSLEVAAADKLHNATSVRDDFLRLGPQLWDRFTVSDPADHLWYYDRLADLIVGRLGHAPTAVALRQVVDELIEAVGVAPATH